MFLNLLHQTKLLDQMDFSVSGMLVYYVNSKLLVSQGNFMNCSKTTNLTEDDV